MPELTERFAPLWEAVLSELDADASLSDREVARLVGTSHKFVGKVRAELAADPVGLRERLGRALDPEAGLRDFFARAAAAPDRPGIVARLEERETVDFDDYPGPGGSR